MNVSGTHLSLPGLSLTWKMPMTGRWSEVLMLEQLVYLTTCMSSACLLLVRILSCGHAESFNPAESHDTLTLTTPASRDYIVAPSIKCLAYFSGLILIFLHLLTVYEGVLCLEVVS